MEIQNEFYNTASATIGSRMNVPLVKMWSLLFFLINKTHSIRANCTVAVLSRLHKKFIRPEAEETHIVRHSVRDRSFILEALYIYSMGISVLNIRSPKIVQDSNLRDRSWLRRKGIHLH